MNATSRVWDWRVEVEPSIYAADFARLGEQLSTLLEVGARVFHYDVGDGHFIESITMGPVVLASIAELIHGRDGRFDCHLMVDQPERHLEQLKAAGADSVTFHLEAVDHPAGLIERARTLDLEVGVAFNPETPVERAAAAAAGADVVTCMSIHPGLSGEEFMPQALGRIETLRRLLPDAVPIQVDGGIKLGEVRSVRDAGATKLVSGSGVFWGDDPAAAYRALVAEARAVGTAGVNDRPAGTNGGGRSSP